MNFHLKFLLSKFEGWKGRHFYGRPRAALSLATPLVVSTSDEPFWLNSFQVTLRSRAPLACLIVECWKLATGVN